MTIHPVIFSVPKKKEGAKGKDFHQFLSSYARDALKKSAEFCGIELGSLEKSEKDVPLPFSGHYWSIAHKPKFVCGVIGKSQIGIDVEELKEHREGMFERIASEEEWKKFSKKNDIAFARVWTAKEAVLKATGVGVSGLSNCKIFQVERNEELLLNFQDKTWLVRQISLNDHFISVATLENESVEWHTTEI